MSPANRPNPSENQFRGQYSKEVFQTLAFAYRPYIGWISLFIITGLLGRFFLLANVNVIGYWVDSLCQGTGCRPLPSWLELWTQKEILALLAGMVTLGFLLTWVFRLGFSTLSAKAVSSLYDETTLRTSRYPISFFDRTPVGRVVTRFSSDYGNVFRLFGGPLAEFLSIVFDLFWILVLISTANLRFLPLLIFMSAINVFIYWLNQERLRRCRRELSASRSPSIAHFSETTQGAPTIRSFSREINFFRRFEHLDQFFLSRKKKAIRAIVEFSLQMNFSTTVLFFLSGLLAYYGIQDGAISVGSTGAAFGLIILSGNTVQMFFEWLAQFEEAMVGVERMDQYLRHPIEPGSFLPLAATFPTSHPKRDATGTATPLANPLVGQKCCSVEFNSVSFRYAEDLPWIFENLSFSVAPGEKLGIIGRTGSGKSSLIQALFHLYSPEKGEIRIGGYSAKLEQSTPLDLEIFRQNLSFIAQDPVLFRGSLRLNLDLKNLYSDSALTDALSQVGLTKWATPAGLSLLIEEKGRNLSVGEKQLICLARALLQDSPVVIMDEATSAVDPQSEEILVKATLDFFKGRTQLIIAHRLSTLESCDRVLWLDHGKIRALGKTSDILSEFKKAHLSH